MAEGKSFEFGPGHEAERVDEAVKAKFIEYATVLTKKEFQPADRTEGRMVTYHSGNKTFEVLYCPEPPDAPDLSKSELELLRRLFSEADTVASLRVIETMPGNKNRNVTYRIKKNGEAEFELRTVDRAELERFIASRGKIEEGPDFQRGVEQRLGDDVAAHNMGFNVATNGQFEEANLLLEAIAKAEREKELGT